MSNYVDIMLDLETMGTGYNAPITSIGAVAFSFIGTEPVEELPHFWRNVDLESSMEAGARPDAGTIMWWLEQGDQARRDLVNPPPVPLEFALREFSRWWTNLRIQNVWAHATFDPPVMASSYRLVGREAPWHRRGTRDLRTVEDIATRVGVDAYKIKKDLEDESMTNHNALADARWQVTYVRSLFAAITRRVAVPVAA